MIFLLLLIQFLGKNEYKNRGFKQMTKFDFKAIDLSFKNFICKKCLNKKKLYKII